MGRAFRKTWRKFIRVSYTHPGSCLDESCTRENLLADIFPIDFSRDRVDSSRTRAGISIEQ